MKIKSNKTHFHFTYIFAPIKNVSKNNNSTFSYILTTIYKQLSTFLFFFFKKGPHIVIMTLK